ncbi:3-carboxy-cis,cis-muconate cyclase [Drepanopeziza brunnea f. sp. 'multigermtubi' MB_m1]|uniref:3-carboxy-cis,cis-muconate cyclase n=2 Tax=Drepanopeziza brunnea f. sp. 'multigermtubi' TaxID=698441 RepID=K1XWM0_MARBU|nr:3-carboxy-cis,cis-muconate cyclase [Drepanopeziza brunnea f. sp. 'multigermtubi' MB_m1]EKD17129.1 3-carboxy-cis,cis-muconate cyclase [Drepanopeziza brunnea f. sp. 'multigermtubi' MB_m1]
MVGTWTRPGAIFTFAFDDETLGLEMVKRTEVDRDEPISWMAFDHAKKNIYGAAMKKWSSFAVKSPTEIEHLKSMDMTHEVAASSPDTNTRAIFLLPAKQPPYNVYGNPFYDHAGYGNVFSVTAADGGLDQCVQNYPYEPRTGIHGMVFDASETYLYSADLRANKIWTHRKDAEGKLTLVGCVEAPDPGDHPRWVALNGRYLYVLMEAGNRLAVYVIDEQSHCPVFTGLTYPLIPPGIPNPKTMYRSDVCTLSHSRQYLFATSRANSFSLTGYIAAFKLGPEGNIERQICLNPTPTSGGHSNAVSPCDWSDEWLALTDDQDGGLEIYRWQGEFLARVARCEVKEPGFGMNAIWYD